jgi:hypothetical protein
MKKHLEVKSDQEKQRRLAEYAKAISGPMKLHTPGAPRETPMVAAVPARHTEPEEKYELKGNVPDPTFLPHLTKEAATREVFNATGLSHPRYQPSQYTVGGTVTTKKGTRTMAATYLYEAEEDVVQQVMAQHGVNRSAAVRQIISAYGATVAKVKSVTSDGESEEIQAPEAFAHFSWGILDQVSQFLGKVPPAHEIDGRRGSKPKDVSKQAAYVAQMLAELERSTEAGLQALEQLTHAIGKIPWVSKQAAQVAERATGGAVEDPELRRWQRAAMLAVNQGLTYQQLNPNLQDLRKILELAAVANPSWVPPTWVTEALAAPPVAPAQAKIQADKRVSR